jgi:hypothetical protein
LAVAFALFAAHSWLYRTFVIDDAYITFRFVQQWINGNGLLFNIGERVEGYSNFLWIVLLAPFAALGVDLEVAAKILGVTCSAVTLWMTWRAATHMGLPGFAPLLMAAMAPFAAWTMGGLETVLFSALVVTSAYLFVREEERWATQGRASAWSGFAFALLALTRPEGLLFGGVAVLLRLWTLWQRRQWPARHDWLRGFLLLVIVGGYFLWRFSYYGYWLPNTVYAKQMGGHPRGLVEGVYYLYETLVALGGFALLALPAAALIGGKRLGVAEHYWLSASGALLLFLFISGGDWMPFNRFAVHGLPLIVLGVEAGLVRLAATWGSISSKGWGQRPLLTLVVGGQLLFFLVQSANVLVLQRSVLQPLSQRYGPVTGYLAAQSWQAGDAIAVIDAGYVPYALPLEVRAVDMVGLTDGHIAHLPPQFPGGLTGQGDGFGKWDPDYVLAQEPRYIHLYVIGEAANGDLITSFTGTTRLVNHPDFRAHYRRLTEPGLESLFVRIE